jgi:hypothetical protein
MTRALMIVEAVPVSPEEEAEFHDWYDNIHIPELLAIVPAFTSARRLKSADGDSYITVYEIDGDVDAARAALGEAQKAGKMSPPKGVRLSPPPSVRYFTNVP